MRNPFLQTLVLSTILCGCPSGESQPSAPTAPAAAPSVSKPWTASNLGGLTLERLKANASAAGWKVELGEAKNGPFWARMVKTMGSMDKGEVEAKIMYEPAPDTVTAEAAANRLFEDNCGSSYVGAAYHGDQGALLIRVSNTQMNYVKAHYNLGARNPWEEIAAELTR